jgi:hypothetical protein
MWTHYGDYFSFCCGDSSRFDLFGFRTRCSLDRVYDRVVGTRYSWDCVYGIEFMLLFTFSDYVVGTRCSLDRVYGIAFMGLSSCYF